MGILVNMGYGQAGDGKNIDILRISKLNWTRMGKFNSDAVISTTVGEQCHRRNRVTLIISKSLKYSTWVQP